ncbi:MAG: Putative NAD(P)H nitroreductase YodC [Opitutia bacterium UBA7350]|nr:MAG: Putative NAD(P)H nitroreductase YodC [Opitutae bacterium UBA7350]
METINAIRERRSVKHFNPEHRICDAEIQQLLDVALLSPTSFNMQNWRFVAVTDGKKKEALRSAAWDQAQVSEASLVILLCANLDAHCNAERYWKNASEAVQKIIVPMIAPFYADNAQLQRDEAMRSIGIASQTIMLAAKAMGYDSCPMIGFDPTQVAKIIDLPDRHVIGLMITVGKALKPANPRPGQLPYEEVVHRDGFPQT